MSSPEHVIATLDALYVVYGYESSPHLDEDNCFELVLVSGEVHADCGERDCCTGDPGTPDDYAEISSQLAELGCELVDFGSASWEGYSCYTPDPGGVRRIKVRFKKEPIDV